METIIKLRPASGADIPALAQLGRDSFTAKFGHLYRAQDLAGFLSDSFSDSAIAQELQDHSRLYCLAENAGALVGYCKIALVTGFSQYARGTRTMELKQLYTDPDQTGGGIGSALMDWAMAEFTQQGADEVLLTVFSENYGAQRFYQRRGFEKRADIYFMVGQHRDDEFLYGKMLR